MQKRNPVTITTKEISSLNGFSIATARREVTQIRKDFQEAGKPVPRRITIALYAQWSGIDEKEIIQFLNK